MSHLDLRDMTKNTQSCDHKKAYSSAILQAQPEGGEKILSP